MPSYLYNGIDSRHSLSVDCAVGQYHHRAADVCVSCPLHSFQDQTAQMSCKPCQDHFYTVSTGTVYEGGCDGTRVFSVLLIQHCMHQQAIAKDTNFNAYTSTPIRYTDWITDDRNICVYLTAVSDK